MGMLIEREHQKIRETKRGKEDEPTSLREITLILEEKPRGLDRLECDRKSIRRGTSNRRVKGGATQHRVLR